MRKYLLLIMLLVTVLLTACSELDTKQDKILLKDTGKIVLNVEYSSGDAVIDPEPDPFEGYRVLYSITIVSKFVPFEEAYPEYAQDYLHLTYQNSPSILQAKLEERLGLMYQYENTENVKAFKNLEWGQELKDRIRVGGKMGSFAVVTEYEFESEFDFDMTNQNNWSLEQYIAYTQFAERNFNYWKEIIENLEDSQYIERIHFDVIRDSGQDA